MGIVFLLQNSPNMSIDLPNKTGDQIPSHPNGKTHKQSVRTIVQELTENPMHEALRNLLIQEIQINGYSPQRLVETFADLLPLPKHHHPRTRERCIALLVKDIIPPTEKYHILTSAEVSRKVSADPEYGDLRSLLLEDLSEKGYSPNRMERDFSGIFPFPAGIGIEERRACLARVLKAIVPPELQHHMKSAEQTMRDVESGSGYRDVRYAIATLVERDAKSAADILKTMEGRIPWPAGTEQATKERLLSELIQKIVLEEARKKAISRMRRKQVKENMQPLLEGGRAWKELMGHVVFNDKEKLYLKKLVKQTEYTKDGHLDHGAIAAAMHDYFGGSRERYTRETCSSCIDNQRRKKSRRLAKNPNPSPEVIDDTVQDDGHLAEDIEKLELDAVRRALGLPTEQEKSLAVPAEFKVEKGETLHAAAARVIADKVAALDAQGPYGKVAILVQTKKYCDALTELQSIALTKAPEQWKPITLQLYALTMLCVDARHYGKEADRFLEFASRKLADADRGLADAMALPASVSGAILQGTEERVSGRYASARPSMMAAQMRTE